MAAVLTLTAHRLGVTAVQFSHDSRFIKSGSWDKTVKVWDSRTGAQVRTMTGHASVVRAVDISHDDRFIVSGSKDKMVMVWDTQTGTCVRTMMERSDDVRAVSFSPDGRFIASASKDKTVKVWDASTGACVRTMMEHSDEVRAVRFSPDGRLIASGSNDCTVKVWDVSTGTCVRTVTGHSNLVWAVDFSPDGRFIASGSCDDTIKLWDAKTGECMLTMVGHSSSVRTVQFSPNGRLIASGSDDETVKVWDAQTGTCVRTMTGHSDQVNAVHFSPDGQFIASSSEDKTIKVWDTSDLKCGSASVSSAADEEQYCRAYWAVAVSENSGALDAQEAQAFFSNAQLSASVLYQMWNEIVTARRKRALSYDDFVLALRWVALAQNGEEASLARVEKGSSSLRAKIDVPERNPFVKGVRSQLETSRFDEYWKVADADGSGEVDVQKAVAFLSKSGLRNRVLNEIWGLATSQGVYSSLDMERFKTVLRLVAMAQKGMKLDLNEAESGEMELIADIKVESAKPVPEHAAEPAPVPAPVPAPEPAPKPVIPVGLSSDDESDTELDSMLTETPLDDMTCEQLARVLEKVLQVDLESVKNVRERKVNGEALHDMKEFQEFVQLSFPDKRKIEKWVAGRKSYEGFEEYLKGVLGGDSERAEHACALLLESHAVSNLDEWLWFRKQPSKRTNMRAIVRLFPELGTWPGGPDAKELKMSCQTADRLEAAPKWPGLGNGILTVADTSQHLRLFQTQQSLELRFGSHAPRFSWYAMNVRSRPRAGETITKRRLRERTQRKRAPSISKPRLAKWVRVCVWCEAAKTDV
ncbi:Vegetative incompatibility protein HET-E-1 [Porphyridium purpureum]|uniref:Vegetative incompatibility protein HET-E-1 n=1 Tax=Porphyridium purpureum TaxID=35688 RepID=A0A5J4YJI9_PORPP|nr:Vegetative incompatibility protein HET-E-1 [Porphyridium purpureum]|eukprot:POR3391..scf291_13